MKHDQLALSRRELWLGGLGAVTAAGAILPLTGSSAADLPAPGPGCAGDNRRSVEIVEAFWHEVWQGLNPDAIDRLVHSDFVITSGGNDIVGREKFKAWVRRFQSEVNDFRFYIVETFQNQDGSRVTSRWRVTGRNNGLMNTRPNDAPFEMFGTAVLEVGPDGLLNVVSTRTRADTKPCHPG
ncbi:hypothetical protein GRI75_12525 [Altererythrobacter soli]|uniref:SnoaL-like domain-containing protein n=1 Tax=Croceibacterium soli TaxID=1739690 RepID=A0A6I4UV80_9SPHN|nr:nuclear transport factor 2 family protein [Croceibacterium soli]MXP42466.1 hypothetical protein [Croceibacterium soli]